MHTYKRSSIEHSSTSRSGTDLTELESLSEAGEEAVGGFCIVRLTRETSRSRPRYTQTEEQEQTA